MKIETLQERIQNAKTKIEKKRGTITKKSALIDKKTAQVSKVGADEAYWLSCEISNLTDDIERLLKEIDATEDTLAKYEAQLKGEIEKESILLKEIPESMKSLQTELVERWDKWDIERREEIKCARREMGYKEFFKRYTYSDSELMYKTNDEIHDSNMQDAKEFIINLYYRVKDITGEVTDWRGIELTAGTGGYPVLNGLVIGKEGRAYVESIYAGGYNIQRLHIRVLVHAR